MTQLFQSFFVNNNWYYLEVPPICPRCNIGGRPILINSSFYWLQNNNGLLFVIFQCFSCSQPFAVDYSYSVQDNKFFPQALYPPRIQLPDIPYEMSIFYPDFYQIYHQANIAEKQKLDQVSGMAYRKAIEFLIKTYLIQKFPLNKDKILAETLMASIHRIEIPHMETLAKAATWLGNDQTHMIQRHQDYGINDIKEFTKALCRLILSEKAAEKALQLTNPSILLQDQSRQ